METRSSIGLGGDSYECLRRDAAPIFHERCLPGFDETRDMMVLLCHYPFACFWTIGFFFIDFFFMGIRCPRFQLRVKEVVNWGTVLFVSAKDGPDGREGLGHHWSEETDLQLEFL